MSSHGASAYTAVTGLFLQFLDDPSELFRRPLNRVAVPQLFVVLYMSHIAVPEGAIKRAVNLFESGGGALSQGTVSGWRWHGRPLLLDGPMFTVSLHHELIYGVSIGFPFAGVHQDFEPALGVHDQGEHLVVGNLAGAHSAERR